MELVKQIRLIYLIGERIKRSDSLNRISKRYVPFDA